MKKEPIDQKLESLRGHTRDSAPGFPPAEEFKAEFFRRANALPPQRPSAFRYVWKIAALFCIVAIASALLLPQLGTDKKISATSNLKPFQKEFPNHPVQVDADSPTEKKAPTFIEVKQSDLPEMSFTYTSAPEQSTLSERTDVGKETNLQSPRPPIAPPVEVEAESAAASLPQPKSARMKPKIEVSKNLNAFGNVVFHDGHASGVNSKDYAFAADMSDSKSHAFGRGDMPTSVKVKEQFNTEEYKNFIENPFLAVSANPLSTFGADVDSASYTNLRRMIMDEKRRPPRDSVRLEECLNYFNYNYPAPEKDKTFNVAFEMDDAPWAPQHKLLLIGVQAKKIEKDKLPPSNFVFLIDDSGSMGHVMPLVIEAMTALTDQLRSQDKVSIVTYGGNVRRLAEGKSGSDKEEIKKMLSKLSAGGYTPGGAGIVEAYKLAHQYFIKGGNNRVVLITDGDFNVGVSSESELVEMVEKERGSAIYLSTFGVGMGNFKDNKLKMLANKGNGNYSYLDNVREARNSMVNEMTGKMFTIAKDVKFQLEFNPAKVHSYRLLGYEFRKLADRDFNDDTKDAGEVGVGHQVTALYELVMADAPDEVKYRNTPKPDDLKYQARTKKASGELLTFKLRYQQPEEKAPSVLQEFTVREMPKPGDNLGWASSVVEFGLLLRESEHRGNASFEAVSKRAKRYLGEDGDGKRVEFLMMTRNAAELKK